MERKRGISFFLGFLQRNMTRNGDVEIRRSCVVDSFCGILFENIRKMFENEFHLMGVEIYVLPLFYEACSGFYAPWSVHYLEMCLS